ncbi:MAG: lipoprotein-releasing ABC transporter permease subunit [Gammaproteobacteria bacterium]|jgi:lipoprotein-releasing system permease protein|nr:lipoprotein-releasing ABC transporter permease subunit [Gammaproteobacteria bacterium]
MAFKQALFIGRRYASIASDNLLVGFISRLSIIGLSLSVAVLIIVFSVMNGFDRELRERILALVPHVTMTTLRNESLMNQEQWQSVQSSIDSNPQVIATAPLIQLQGMVLANGKSRGILLNGVEPVAEARVSILQDFMNQGSLTALAPRDFSILIGSGIAEHLNLEVGDELTLVSSYLNITPLGEFPRQRIFTVGGIFTIGSQLDDNLALVHMSDAQLLYRLGDNIHGLRIQLQDLFASSTLIRELQNRIAGEYAFSNWTIDYGNIYDNIQLSKSMVGLLLFLLIAVAAFNVVVSLFMVVRDKQSDIAILRTMGSSFSSIRNIFLVQGVIIAIVGTLVGLIIGVLGSIYISDLFAWFESVAGLELLSADVYPINYLPSQLLVSDLGLVCSISIILSLLATLYPAYSAARVDPAQTLRYE